MYSSNKNRLRDARKTRVRVRVAGSPQRPRLTVFRSLSHIYVQVIDDVQGHTLVAASTVDKELREEAASLPHSEKAVKVGKLIAQRCLEKKIECVVFDRNGFKYHGVVKKLADAAREAGLKL